MVLRARNFSKRFSNSENAPPSKSLVSLTERVTASLQEAARRRRARTSGAPRTPRIQVEQSQKRSQVKTRPTIQFKVAAPPASANDTEMAEPLPLPAVPGKVPMTLPRYLIRPEYKEISKAALQAVGPGLENIEYIQELLPSLSHEMMRTIAAVNVQPMSAPKPPSELQVTINGSFLTDIPSHLLAVHRSLPQNENQEKPPTEGPTKATIYPIHNIVLAAHCANLPPLPTSPVHMSPATDKVSMKVTLPVVCLGLPVPEIFPLLSSYLYYKQTLGLHLGLLPAGCALPQSLHPGAQTPADEKARAVKDFARRLAQTYTVYALLQSIYKVNSLWRNVCSLGIFEDGIWQVMDSAWEILLTALAISTGEPDLMLKPSSSPSKQ